MSTVDGPLALGTGEQTRSKPMGVFTRAGDSTGWRSWITTVDHKRIGIMYGVASIFFFLIGGVEALLIRLQLATPNGKVLSADLYNQVYTMHGTTMIFLVVMPIGAAFMNYLLPLQIGARDVAFPRLCSVASCSTRVGCWEAAPTAAGSTTRRTTASCSRPPTASTSGTWA